MPPAVQVGGTVVSTLTTTRVLQMRQVAARTYRSWKQPDRVVADRNLLHRDFTALAPNRTWVMDPS